jgi:aminopeptidase N
MKIYVRKSQAEKFKQHAAEVFRLNREGIKYLESYFDYKFPFPKYDLVLIPEFPFGGMEHAGATFLRESSVIFPSEPTKNDYVSRANVIFHEAAHQWFGDTVTMKWFDDLWLKEGFAEFMAYKTLEKVMPEYNAWKIFYERNKQAAYLTDSTKGTTPIYQEIPNLSSAKSAYGNIVYRKAPSFLRQAEFFLGEDKFQTAVRAFLKKHEFANAEWTDLVKEFETASKQDLKDWANVWVKQRGLPIFNLGIKYVHVGNPWRDAFVEYSLNQEDVLKEKGLWQMKTNVLMRFEGKNDVKALTLSGSENPIGQFWTCCAPRNTEKTPDFIFPNYQDYGYGIFLLDEQSRAYVLANIQTEKDDFLRTMMWGALWDSVRETELAPKDYVELVIKNITVESDESTIQMLLGRVGTAMNYYLSEPSAVADGLTPSTQNAKVSKNSKVTNAKLKPSATADGSDLSARLEAMLIDKIANAQTLGQRITFYRAFLNLASSAKSAQILKDILAGKSKVAVFNLKTKDKFDIVTRLLILGDKDAPNLLANLEKTETSDEAKRYAYAARAGIGTAENKAQYFRDFIKNKDISESWIEAALNPFNSVRHSDLTAIYLETALSELPNLKRNRKIFFINGWLGAFIGGQRSEESLAVVNKFLADNPNLDKDLRLKILENVDGLERAVKIRAKYGK